MMYKTARIGREVWPSARHILVICFASVIALLCLLPFLWMVLMSFKTETEIWIMPPSIHPSSLTPDVYKDVWQMTTPNIRLAIRNSFLVAIASTAGSLLTSSLAAYAFAKLRFKGSGLMFGILLATMMVPGQVTLIPMYILIKYLGWINTFYPLIVPNTLVYAYGVFLLKQHISAIPDSIVESAKLDGASQPSIYARLVLPMTIPSLATITMIQFMGSWNSFLSPMIYINDIKKLTLPLYINAFRGAYQTKWNYLMAASCIAIIPMIALYLVTQRYLTDGIMIGGVKG